MLLQVNVLFLHFLHPGVDRIGHLMRIFFKIIRHKRLSEMDRDPFSSVILVIPGLRLFHVTGPCLVSALDIDGKKRYVRFDGNIGGTVLKLAEVPTLP